jgi:hypothetical protein
VHELDCITNTYAVFVFSKIFYAVTHFLFIRLTSRIMKENTNTHSSHSLLTGYTWKYDICFVDRLSVSHEMLFVSRELQILRPKEFRKLNRLMN